MVTLSHATLGLISINIIPYLLWKS